MLLIQISVALDPALQMLQGGRPIAAESLIKTDVRKLTRNVIMSIGALTVVEPVATMVISIVGND